MNKNRLPFVILSQDDEVTSFEILPGQPPGIIDTDDADRVSKLRFLYHAGRAEKNAANGEPIIYARAHISKDGRETSVQLHNFIIGPRRRIKGWVNGNRLDCRRDNLITVSRRSSPTTITKKTKASGEAITKRPPKPPKQFVIRPLIGGSILKTLEQNCIDIANKK